MAQMHQLFDRKVLRMRRNRSAATLDDHDFLLREVAARLAERLEDVKRDFSRILVVGDSGEHLKPLLRSIPEILVCTDIAEKHLSGEGKRVVCDEEALPFAGSSFDLVLALWNLHWVNDLPGALIQLNRCLRPDGLLLAIMPGAGTLAELRESIVLASADKGLSPRISPFVEVRDAGSLLQRAGYTLPVADSDNLTVSYDNAFSLFKDLRGMGEVNMLHKRHKHFTTHNFWLRVAETYHQHFADAEGRIPATFELVTLTGWHPDASQQQPAIRGSGKVSLKEVFDAPALPDE